MAMKLFILGFILSAVLPTLVKAQTRVMDIGVMGLASHDIFTWSKSEKRNLENSRLDLSTIFDYNEGKDWESGGNPKNSENAPVWSVTKRLVEYYKLLLEYYTHEEARKMTVEFFHNLVRISYKNLTLKEFPTSAINKKASNIEQAVMRAMHDILPGSIKLYRPIGYPAQFIDLTDFRYSKLFLNLKELEQEIPFYDGDYDDNYKNIILPNNLIINLKEIDRNFISNNSHLDLDFMLGQFKRASVGEISFKEISFMKHIEILFSKAICSKNNKWINNRIPCH